MEGYRRHVERRSRTAGTLPVRLALMGPGGSLTDVSTTACSIHSDQLGNLYSNTDTQRKGLTEKTVDIFARLPGPSRNLLPRLERSAG